MIIVCHEMKWTYLEYIEQPYWFISAIQNKLNIENHFKNKEIKKQQRNSRRK